MEYIANFIDVGDHSLLILLFVGSIIVLIIKLLSSKKMTIKAGPVELSTEEGNHSLFPINKKDEKKEEVDAITVKTKYKEDVQSLYDSIAAKLYDLYEDQANQLEYISNQKSEDVGDVLSKSYADLVIQATEDAQVRAMQNNIFNAWIVNSLLDTFKNDIRLQHLSKQSDSDLEEYSKNIAQRLINRLKRELGTTYQYLSGLTEKRSCSDVDSLFDKNISLLKNHIANFIVEYQKMQQDKKTESERCLQMFISGVGQLIEDQDSRKKPRGKGHG